MNTLTEQLWLFNNNMTTEAAKEPEELIGEALYLLQLCQQDLNMGRTITVYARARKAREQCQDLEDMFNASDEAFV